LMFSFPSSVADLLNCEFAIVGNNNNTRAIDLIQKFYGLLNVSKKEKYFLHVMTDGHTNS
jgi:hypothetical protein